MILNEILETIPVIKLANLPTPLEEAKHLAEKIGLNELYIKRDDLSGLAGGGNKSRKLEYDFAEIVNGRYDVIITAGGIQSNHARMTAAAARKVGIDVKLVLGGADFETLKGNLLLDVLFGTEIRYLIDDDTNESLIAETEKWAEELLEIGKKPFVLPIGGSTALGALGYVRAMEELAGQLNDGRVQIIMGVGSCGTFAGSILGAKIFMPDARIIGISIARKNDEIKQRTKELIEQSAELIEYNIDCKNLFVECYDNYFLEYGIITEEGKRAIIDCANLEGILLDPIYTGKVMSGLIDLVEREIIDKNIPVIFIHTGGMPIIFSFESEFGKYANIAKVKNN